MPRLSCKRAGLLPEARRAPAERSGILPLVPETPPRVSVIIPAYNAAATLERAVASVLAQTCRPLEVLVVDDGSTDATPQVVARLGDAVRAIRQPNQGVSVARNEALRRARGDLIAFLDADDEWLPAKLENQVDFLAANPAVDLVYTQVYCVDGQGRDRGTRPLERGLDTYAHLFFANRIPTSTVLVRRTALERAGEFDPALKITQDYDLWLRIAARGAYSGLREPLARYWMHGTGLSSDPLGRYREHLQILERVPLRPDAGVDAAARERARAHYQYRLGRLAARDRRWAEAAGLFAPVLRRPSRYGLRRRGPADLEVHYWRALRWYLWCRVRASFQADGGVDPAAGPAPSWIGSHDLIYRKRKYHFLSFLMPTWCLRRKVRRGYLARVAAELARGAFLDVGCGVGVATILYGRLSRSPGVGLDAWREMLSVARYEARRHRSHARFVHGAAERLPFPHGSFDTLYLGQILEHLTDIDPVVTEADRVLKPGGRMIISVPDRGRVPSPGHVRTFDAAGLQALFSGRGYGGIALHPFDDRRLVCSGIKPRACARQGPVATAAAGL